MKEGRGRMESLGSLVCIFMIISLLKPKRASKDTFVCLFVVCFPGVTTHCGCIFHSPVAGFSLLLFEVS
jgi:hypothetical protein